MKGNARIWRLRLLGWRLLHWRLELAYLLALGALFCIGLWEFRP